MVFQTKDILGVILSKCLVYRFIRRKEIHLQIADESEISLMEYIRAKESVLIST